MEEKKKEMTLGQQINLVTCLMFCVCWPLYPWLTVLGTWGCHFAGVPAVIGILIVMPAWIAYVDNSDRYARWAFILTVGLCLIHRIAGLFNRKPRHSHHPGQGWVGVKWEPLLVVMLSFAAAPFSQGLWSYLFAAGICHGLTLAYSRAAMRAKARTINDSRIEQEHLMNLHRNIYGD